MIRDSSGPMFVPFRPRPTADVAVALAGALYLALVVVFLVLTSHLLTP